MAQNVNPNKMGTMPIGRLLFNMALPITVSMMFQALYNIVDSYFVSQLSQDAMNAVSLAFPLQTILIGFSVGTGVGISALISRSLGEGNQERARQVAGTGMFLELSMALLFSVIGLIFARRFMEIQTENEVIRRYGGSYVTIVMGICFFLFSQVTMERLLQSTGRTDKSMICQLVGTVVNVVLDPLLIFGYAGFPRLEVTGAAVATIIGQACATATGILLNLKFNTELKAAFRMIRFRASIALSIYKIALPTIIMQSIGSVVNFLMNQILISFTEAATAVYGVYFKLQSFIFMPIFGMNNAMVPILSYNYGAGNRERVHKTFRYALSAAISFMTLGALVFFFSPDALIGIFKPSAEMASIGARALRIICLHFPLAGFCIVSISVCQAIGQPFHSLLISTCRQVVVLLPAAYLLSRTGVLDNVWYCFPIAEVVSFILSFIFLRINIKRADAVMAA